jgi:hypothetical protein
MVMRKAFCLITVKPHKIWLDFLNTMTDNYDVFLIIDDNSDYEEIIKDYPLIIFIQIGDHYSRSMGYVNSNFTIKKKPSGWDKALLYFSKINTEFDYCWFCEEDVFFNSVETILKTDREYPTSDLLCKYGGKNETGDIMGWHWHQAAPFFKLPWLNAMICCSRLSKHLLTEINKFVAATRTLTFVECSFPTIAHHMNMKIDSPPTFETIYWRYDWANHSFNDRGFYHPLKNVEDHRTLRETGKFS